MWTKSTSIHGMQIVCSNRAMVAKTRSAKANEKKKNDDTVVMAPRFMLNWATINICASLHVHFSVHSVVWSYFFVCSRITCSLVLLVRHTANGLVVCVRFFRCFCVLLIEFDFIMVYLLLLLIFFSLIFVSFTINGLLAMHRVCMSHHNHNLLALFEFTTVYCRLLSVCACAQRTHIDPKHLSHNHSKRTMSFAGVGSHSLSLSKSLVFALVLTHLHKLNICSVLCWNIIYKLNGKIYAQFNQNRCVCLWKHFCLLL